MESISRITNWHDTKVKYDSANATKYANKTIESEMKYALREIKTVRTTKLRELYLADA